MKTKKCSNCFEEKPLNEFYVKREKQGRYVYRQSRCKACNPEVVASYRKQRRERERYVGTP